LIFVPTKFVQYVVNIYQTRNYFGFSNNSLEKKCMKIMATVYKTDVHCFEFDV